MRAVALVAGGVAAGLVLAGCGRGESQDKAVVASSPTCQTSDQPGGCTDAVTIAASEAELTAALAAWGYPVGAVTWLGHPLLVVAMNETSSCRAVVRRVEIDGSAVAVDMGLERKGSCTTDSRPRSFVLAPGADSISAVTVNGAPVDLRHP